MNNHIIPIFVPHLGCPHQCIFCDQQKITGVITSVTAEQIENEIIQGLKITGPKVPAVAFYGGSFTALPIALQTQLLQPAVKLKEAGKISGIRISTRPDAVSEAILQNLQQHGVTTVELGAQSLDDRVLRTAGRGHTYQDVVNAVRLLKQFSIFCGLQLMIGLPEEGWASLLTTARRALELSPDFARIYPAVVIAGTRLADLQENRSYSALSLEEAVRRSAFLKLLLQYQNEIPVIRTGLQASASLNSPGTVQAGPYHPAFGEMVESYIYYLMLERIVDQLGAGEAIVHCYFRDESKLRGIHKQNLLRLSQNYPQFQINRILPDEKKSGQITIEVKKIRYSINAKMLFNI